MSKVAIDRLYDVGRTLRDGCRELEPEAWYEVTPTDARQMREAGVLA